MSDNEAQAVGLNDSLTHVDFMNDSGKMKAARLSLEATHVTAIAPADTALVPGLERVHANLKAFGGVKRILKQQKRVRA